MTTQELGNFTVTGKMHYPIQPLDIDTNNRFADANNQFADTFGSFKREVSANWVVRFCQEQCSWKPFTFKEIEYFQYRNCRRLKRKFCFNGLDTDSLIVLENGKYHVTHDFIARCFLASPKKPRA